MEKARYYVDTSAYLCVLLGESGHAEFSALFARGVLLSSTLLVLEAQRNLVRLARAGDLSAKRLQAALDRLDEDVESFMLRDVTLNLCKSRSMPVVSTPRSLDLVHLRTALWFHADQPLTRVLTRDKGFITAARELSLPT